MLCSPKTDSTEKIPIAPEGRGRRLSHGQFKRHIKSYEQRKTEYFVSSSFCSPGIAWLRFVGQTQCFHFLSFMDCQWVRFVFTSSCLLTRGKEFKELVRPCWPRWHQEKEGKRERSSEKTVILFFFGFINLKVTLNEDFYIQIDFYK